MTTDRTEPEQVKESVTNVIFVSGESSPTLMQSPPNWQQIIWREWRNCNDAEYAEHLYRLIAGEPIDRQAILMISVLAALPGIDLGAGVAAVARSGRPPTPVWTRPARAAAVTPPRRIGPH